MAFKQWRYTITYNDGIIEQGGIGASSYSEAYAKVKAGALARGIGHKGVADIQVYE